MDQPPQETIRVSPTQLKLNKEFSEKLKLFFMFVKNNPSPPAGESIGCIIAYRAEDAVSRGIRDYPTKNIFYQGQFIEVENLIKQLYTQDGKIEISAGPDQVQVKPMPKEKLSREQFKSGLLMVLNEFTPKEDQETLKGIIEKI